MKLVPGIAGIVLFLVILWDAFETVVLPRRVNRHFRLTRAFYRSTWVPWRAFAGLLPPKRRDLYLGFYGPLSLLMLLGVWALGQVFAFALLHYALGSQMIAPGDGSIGFGTDLYMSGTTFFTLGLGDVVPRGAAARSLAVVEAGLGFGFLAVVIGYLPVIYQAFSRREVTISLLDARAGSPPSAGELLRRHAGEQGKEDLRHLLSDWERWSAELMESHLSYGNLCYFRSQHSNQSWLSALTAILDTCALVMSSTEGACKRQAQLTFAIARHAVVDLSQVFIARPLDPDADRLPPEELHRLRANLAAVGFQFSATPESDAKLAELRKLYEPFVYTLGRVLRFDLPPWIPTGKLADNWQTTAWNKATIQVVSGRLETRHHEDHF